MTKTAAPIRYDSTSYLIRRLLGNYIAPYSKKLVMAVLCMIAVAAATATNAWMMQPVLDEVFLNKQSTMLLVLPLGVLTIAVIKGAAAYGQSYIMKYVGQRIVTDMQIELYDHMLSADISTFGNQHSGSLISRFSNDIQVMRRSVSNVLTSLAREALTLVFLIGLMFYQNWLLSLIAFGAFPLAIYPMLRLGRRMRKLSSETQQKLGDFTARLDETFQGVKVIKAYNRESYETKRANQLLESLFKLYAKAARTESLTSPIMEMLGGIAVAAVVWYGGAQVMEGTTTPGAFFSFITALIMAYKPMKSTSGLNAALQEGLASAKRLFMVLDTLPVVVDKADAEPLALTQGAVAFENVYFDYNSKDHPALSGISFDVPPGKTVALVGASGAGKSTVMQLMLRYYDPQQGRITIDGQDTSQVTIASLREAIALVSQEVMLFDDTIRANIAYGKLDASDEEIARAAQLAAAHDFITALPEGYSTLIGQHGFKLSGGQRQRIAIARAILKNAPILLLDEATSALDTLSEKQIQQALDSLKKGRTTLIIAHRLSTIQDADRIYVMDKGTVVESGTHTELLAKKGYYTALYTQQASLHTPNGEVA